ncbi:CoA-binding protein [Chloroflexota bacterium]
MSNESLDFLFHPHSITFAGITVANPEHWTRIFLHAIRELGYEGPMYLVNLRGGEIDGLKVYRRLEDISHGIDYVISTVPARAAPGLVEACAEKGVRAVHFCTSGFSETGEPEGIKLEAELSRIAREKHIRVIGPNCMGIYCPESRISFDMDFPKESGSVAFVSQSGGNCTDLIKNAKLRGIRLSKVISYGNACDLDESDFIDYLATDPDTKIIAIYIEGVKDGTKLRRALEKAVKGKVVILLKGGVTEAGARAAASHTASLAGSEAIWDSLCKQLGIIRVSSLDELIDVLVTLVFMSQPCGRNAAIIGGGGGASVLITDEFEKKGLKVPLLPQEIRNQMRQFTPIAGNILQNPVDYSQNILEVDSVVKAVNILAQWEGVDLVVEFLRPTHAPRTPDERGRRILRMADGLLQASRNVAKPAAIVLEHSILPEQVQEIFALTQEFIALGLPVYFSFASAANAINAVLNYYENQLSQIGT